MVKMAKNHFHRCCPYCVLILFPDLKVFLKQTNKQTMKCILRSIVWDGCRKEITRRFFFVFSFLHPNLIFKNVLSRPFDLHNSRSPICIWLLFLIVLTVAVNCCCFTVTSISTVYLSSHA